MAKRAVSPEKTRRISAPESMKHPLIHPTVGVGTAVPPVKIKTPSVPGFETTDTVVVAYLRSLHLKHETESGEPRIYGYPSEYNERITQALDDRKQESP